MTLPYPPSYLARVLDSVDRLPGPNWLAYLVFALGLILVHAAIKWRDGAYPPGAFYPMHVAFMAAGPYYLALIHYLDGAAARALGAFRPALDLPEPELPLVRYRLTTLPARPVLWVTWFAVLYAGFLLFMVYRWVPLRPAALAFTSVLSTGFEATVFVLVTLLFALFVYHTIHQLRVANWLYTAHTRISLFDLTPLYAFSRLAASTSIGWILIAYARGGAAPDLTEVMVAGDLLATGLGLVIFLWPLLGIHRLLVEKKNHAKAVVGRLLEETLDELHRRVAAGRFEEAAPVDQAVAGLKQELELLDKIPTWPWQPETFRGVVTALLLPILLGLINRLLERWVGF
ncbi:MAG TPA: hypothetical protein VNK95_05490 [Caldilineaceae bacterium]|nr:hypothetical protein [Caldilineaceae bacterium]